MNQLWLLGFVLNIFLLYSVFDIHFKSPVVQVSEVFRGSQPSGLHRIVVIVGDGLRADSFYENPDLRPFLTSIMNSTRGAWGISDTRVPTESRPGHVAIFSGLYEDPSAVFTGWKENLVAFDSVFNRSSYGIALGSPDVVQMFRKGIREDRLYIKSYPSDWQDFLAANSSVLDTWVLEEFSTLIQSRTIPDEKELLIFLHLLGIDNTGHAMKPHSAEYNGNIKIVDGIIQKVHHLVSNYFRDDKTLFIFTADHGMTDWGSHGSGSKAETETPYVIWGPGVSNAKEKRVKQADLAALMSGALNIPFPTNSVGRFPTFLWKDDKFAFDALRANFWQIQELMKIKKQLVVDARHISIASFPLENELQGIIRAANESAVALKFEKAILLMQEAITVALEGVDYYERYDRHMLTTFAVSTFLLWMLLILSALVFPLKIQNSLFCRKKNLAYVIGFAVFITKGLIGWSLWRTVYLFVPIYLAELIRTLWLDVKINGSVDRLKSLLPLLVLCVCGAEILVNSIEVRSVLTLGLVVNAIWSMKGKKLSTWQMFLWLGSIAVLGLFPLAPVIGKKQNPFFMTAGPLVSGILAVSLISRMPPLRGRDRVILSSQTGLLFSVAVLIHFPSSLITRTVSWSSVVFSFFGSSFTSASNFTVRLLSVFVGISTPFALLSLSYESLFLPCLFFTLLNILKFETASQAECTSWRDFFNSLMHIQDREGFEKPKAEVDLHQSFRTSWFHLFFVYLSFFGTGNIGSVSSFDPTAVRCFVSVFNPFVMMVALLEKIVGPFLLVSCFFRLLLTTKVQVERNFLIVLLLCQGMALHTFFGVRTTGSWLEIGTSISHYVIVQCTTLFLFLLHFASYFLISVSMLPSECVPVIRTRADAGPIEKTK